MKLEKEELAELRLVNAEFMAQSNALSVIQLKLQLADEQIARLVEGKKLLLIDENKIKEVAIKSKETLDTVVENIKQKYGLEDNDQIDFETGEIIKSEREEEARS